MEASEIRNRIREYIEHADDRMLRIINTVLETEKKEISQEHKDILDERLRSHQQKPEEGKSWAEVKKGLKNKYGL